MCDLNFGSVPDWLIFITGVASLCFLKKYVDDTAEIRKTSDSQFKLAERISAEQSIDDHFFKMLDGYYKLVDSLRMKDLNTLNLPETDARYISGKGCLKHLSENIPNTIPLQKLEKETDELFKIRFTTIFKPFYEQNAENLSHYFRYLYNFFKYINDNTGDRREQYINLLKANLADFEFELIFLNGLTPNGQKFKDIVEINAIFENWFRDSNPRTLFMSLRSTGVYKDSAYISIKKI